MVAIETLIFNEIVLAIEVSQIEEQKQRTLKGKKTLQQSSRE